MTEKTYRTNFHLPTPLYVKGGSLVPTVVFSPNLWVLALFMAVFGAILMYILSMASLFRLRKTKPHMERPFRAPFYPWFPGFSMAAAVVCLIALTYYNFTVALIFVACHPVLPGRPASRSPCGWRPPPQFCCWWCARPSPGGLPPPAPAGAARWGPSWPCPSCCRPR